MKTRVFTTGVVLDRWGRLLILKRKEDDDTYPGVWDCVGGHFEPGESAEACMLREAREESGQPMKIIKVGPLIEYMDAYGRAVAVPFMLKPDTKREITPSEHSAFKWIRLSDVANYHIVPDLAKALELFGLRSTAPRAPRQRQQKSGRGAGSPPEES